MRHLISQSALLISLLLAVPAVAFVTSVNVSPSNTEVGGSGLTTVTFRWTVGVQEYTAQPLTVTSPSGTLSAGGHVTTTGATLSRTIAHPGGGNVVNVVFTETLRVDRTTAQYIAKTPGGSFTRSFSSGGFSPSGLTGTVLLSAGISENISYQDYTLLFDDRTQYRLVRRGEALTAIANITSSGRGVFNGVWEIQDPNGGAFRPLRRERVVLSGPRATTFESPPLPTSRPGQYRIRFSIGSRGQDGSPEISYVVTPLTGEGSISLRSPEPGGKVTLATRFEWSRVTGAARYRVEFLDPGSNRLLAAVDARGTQTQLRPFTLARIQGLGQIVWRVAAYDGRGRTLARSQSRVLGSDGTFLHGSR